MTYLLALDPSLTSSGCAFFVGGKLFATWRSRGDSSKIGYGYRCFDMATEIVEQLKDHLKPHHLPAMKIDLVFEWPQIYRAAKSKGDPNDLMPLAGIGMAVAGLLDTWPYTYTPAEWAGQLPKFTKGEVSASPRAQRIRSRLTAKEAKHWQDQHDIIDAIGIGLHHLKRLSAKRVLPGAT